MIVHTSTAAAAAAAAMFHRIAAAMWPRVIVHATVSIGYIICWHVMVLLMLMMLGTMHYIAIVRMALATATAAAATTAMTMIPIWHMRWIPITTVSIAIRTEMIGIESLIEHISAVHRCKIATEIWRMHTIAIHIKAIRIVAVVE